MAQLTYNNKDKRNSINSGDGGEK